MVRVELSMWKRAPQKEDPKQDKPDLERFTTIVYLNQSLDFKEIKTPINRFRIV